MKLSQTLKRHVSFLNFALLGLVVVIIYYLGSITGELFNPTYEIPVIELNAKLLPQDTSAVLVDRTVHSILQIEAKHLIDHVLLDKRVGRNVFQLIFSLLICYQLYKIHTNWYEKHFSKKLYAMIDTLSVMATIMWLFSRLQEWRQEFLLKNVYHYELANAVIILFFTFRSP